jgi:hypothetical protein
MFKMKKLLVLLGIVILFVNLSYAQNSDSKSFSNLMEAKNLNEFLKLETTAEVTYFSIVIYVDDVLKAFPSNGSNGDDVFNELQAELSLVAENSDVTVIVADLEYVNEEQISQVDVIILNNAEFDPQDRLMSSLTK